MKALKAGDVKGNLTVLEVKPYKRGGTAKCLCSCGAEVWFQISRISGHRSRFASCNISGHRFVNVLHGYSRRGQLRTPEYCAWVEMRQRCENKNDAAFVGYGGRGIRVCRRWLKFENFLKDMGKRPSPGLTLGRIYNDRGYSPSNCRWETKQQQARNRRSTRLLTIAGESKSIAEWSEIKGMRAGALSLRLARGWSEEKTLTIPAMTNQYG